MLSTASSAASPRGTLSTALRQQAPLACVLLIAIGHALPALLSAAELHSDAAIVGLQARHLLRGEWSWFLWGSGYQTSVDSFVAALFFSVLGATPLALTLSSFCGYLLLVGLAFGTLRRRFDAWRSALLVSPLILATGPLHTYMFSPPRQASLTLVFAAIWLIDGAPRWRYRASSLAAGACVAGLSCFADPYGLVFLPGVLGFLLLCVIDAPSEHRARGVAAGTLGAIAGLIPWWLLTQTAQASHGVLGLESAVIAHNLRLLGQTCLPYLLGTTAYFSPRAPIVQAWSAPGW